MVGLLELLELVGRTPGATLQLYFDGPEPTGYAHVTANEHSKDPGQPIARDIKLSSWDFPSRAAMLEEFARRLRAGEWQPVAPAQPEGSA